MPVDSVPLHPHSHRLLRNHSLRHLLRTCLNYIAFLHALEAFLPHHLRHLLRICPNCIVSQHAWAVFFDPHSLYDSPHVIFPCTHQGTPRNNLDHQ